MTPSFRERVETLLLDANVYPAKVKVLVPEILSLVKEMVPESLKPVPNDTESQRQFEHGWKNFRQAILNEIGEE